MEAESTTVNSSESDPEAPETEGPSADLVSQQELSIVGETLEDMSLSSTSSLDRDDTSQEYMDDFDNLGSGGVAIILLSSKNAEDDSGLDQSCARFDDDEAMTKSKGLCFLDDSMDWDGVTLSGELQPPRLSGQSRSDYHDQGGSSLDLSPSDSCGSGGTYMWDEEGLEPLGGGAMTASINSNSNASHHIGSFDSDLNSNDLLTHLDSADLDDDDLMLDVDFSEDASLHGDLDRTSQMAQWRRRQLCWGTQDIHNDHESDFQGYKLSEDPGNKRSDPTLDADLILDFCPPRSSFLSPDGPGLGLDVEELAEDCCAVRSQLENLHRLLLQDDDDDGDDDTLTTDTLSPEAAESSQVQALLQEVQQLREELRSRDQTIARLSVQLTVPKVTTRCLCQQTAGRMDRHTQTSVTERESVASQTPWREHRSQVLHSSTQEDQKPLRNPPPPPGILCSNHPADHVHDCPETNAIRPTAARGEDDGKNKKGEMKERRGTHNRSLRLPQPSKLHLFMSQTAGSAAAAPPETEEARRRPAPPKPDNSSTAGSKSKPLALTSVSSRLPKPKSH